jgi:hypothetical protein
MTMSPWSFQARSRIPNCGAIKSGFHVLVALVLIGCVLCPFFEVACGSNNSIFASGQDRETTIAVVLLLLELAFALASLLVILLVPALEKGRLVVVTRFREFVSFFAAFLPELSPPIPLRI